LRWIPIFSIVKVREPFCSCLHIFQWGNGCGNGSNRICLRHPESWIFDFCRCDFRKYFPCSGLWEKRFFRVYGDDKKKSDFFFGCSRWLITAPLAKMGEKRPKRYWNYSLICLHGKKTSPIFAPAFGRNPLGDLGKRHEIFGRLTYTFKRQSRVYKGSVSNITGQIGTRSINWKVKNKSWIRE
jgi:hypothetical protein